MVQHHRFMFLIKILTVSTTPHWYLLFVYQINSRPSFYPTWDQSDGYMLISKWMFTLIPGFGNPHIQPTLWKELCLSFIENINTGRMCVHLIDLELKEMTVLVSTYFKSNFYTALSKSSCCNSGSSNSLLNTVDGESQTLSIIHPNVVLTCLPRYSLISIQYLSFHTAFAYLSPSKLEASFKKSVKYDESKSKYWITCSSFLSIPNVWSLLTISWEFIHVVCSIIRTTDVCYVTDRNMI